MLRKIFLGLIGGLCFSLTLLSCCYIQENYIRAILLSTSLLFAKQLEGMFFFEFKFRKKKEWLQNGGLTLLGNVVGVIPIAILGWVLLPNLPKIEFTPLIFFTSVLNGLLLSLGSKQKFPLSLFPAFVAYVNLWLGPLGILFFFFLGDFSLLSLACVLLSLLGSLLGNIFSSYIHHLPINKIK